MVSANARWGDGGKGIHQRFSQTRETIVLGVRIKNVIGSFQLDSDGKIVAACSSFERGNSGMPSPVETGNELSDRSLALDQKVGGNGQLANFGEERVFQRVERVAEKRLDLLSAELTGWQADIVDDQ